ncbi:MAG: hypothetical protein WD768_01790 [Phycisphaeraceae bacterium]
MPVELQLLSLLRRDQELAFAFGQLAQQRIASKQNMETYLIKSLIQNLPQYEKFAPAEKEALGRIADALVKHDKDAREDVAAFVKPVKHTIKIETVK